MSTVLSSVSGVVLGAGVVGLGETLGLGLGVVPPLTVAMFFTLPFRMSSEATVYEVVKVAVSVGASVTVSSRPVNSSLTLKLLTVTLPVFVTVIRYQITSPSA